MYVLQDKQLFYKIERMIKSKMCNNFHNYFIVNIQAVFSNPPKTCCGLHWKAYNLKSNQTVAQSL